MMEPDGSKEQVYTPHLKKVLRSFQASANTSLHGPNSVMGMWRASQAEKSTTQIETPTTVTTIKTAPKPPEDDPFTAPPPFPIQQPPIFTPPDQSGCEKTDTILENETISCFSVGGERRLCLPQILNTVLRDFSLQQINSVCDKLHIFCSRCTAEQLEVLKNTGVLPLSAPSCGLITKSDAERLCSALLDSNPPKVMRNPDVKPPYQVRVHHECFGKCSGLYTPDLYLDPLSRCIECTECHGLFSPQRFVCHAHHPKENRTCHWGFDSFNWRFYLNLDSEFEDDLQMKDVLKEMKSRYDYNPDYKYKRKQIHSESRDPSKKLRIDNFYPYPYALEPPLVYWYPNPAWNKVATFKPLRHVFNPDEKPLLIAPEALPHFLKERSPYFLHDATLLQSSDHVLPLPDNERYETHYHTTVTYGPNAIHKLGIKRDYESEEQVNRKVHKESEETVSKKSQLKKEPNISSCCFETDETFSDTSSSTLSGADEGLVITCEDEVTAPSPVEGDLQSLVSLLGESGIETTLCTKIVTEVENIVAKYRKCLKASIQSKSLMQTEFEKLHSKQQDKIRRLKETRKFLEKEILKIHNDTVKVSNSSITKTAAVTPETEPVPLTVKTLVERTTDSPRKLEDVDVTTTPQAIVEETDGRKNDADDKGPNLPKEPKEKVDEDDGAEEEEEEDDDLGE